MSKIEAIHRDVGLPTGPSWAGYWTFVTATIFLMFVLFLAKKGTLGTWIGFFSWSNPVALGSEAGGATTGATSPAPGSDPSKGTPVGTVLGMPGVTTLSPGASGIVQGQGGTELLNPGPAFTLPSLSGVGSWFGGLFGTPATGK